MYKSRSVFLQSISSYCSFHLVSFGNFRSYGHVTGYVNRQHGRKSTWADPKGGQGVRTPPRKLQVAIGFLRTSGTDPPPLEKQLVYLTGDKKNQEMFACSHYLRFPYEFCVLRKMHLKMPSVEVACCIYTAQNI